MYEEILSRVIEALEYCDKDPIVAKGILKEIRLKYEYIVNIS